MALTRVLSSVFRKGGDVAFLVEELKAVFDPAGGYFAGEGRFMPSIIAELGYVIEKHFTLDKSNQTIRDHTLSATPNEFKTMTEIGRDLFKKVKLGIRSEFIKIADNQKDNLLDVNVDKEKLETKIKDLYSEALSVS